MILHQMLFRLYRPGNGLLLCKLDRAVRQLVAAECRILPVISGLDRRIYIIRAWPDSIENSIKNQKNRKKSIDYLRKRLYYILIGL